MFSVPGRTAQQMFIEFGAPFPGIVPQARDYTARIEVKLGHRRKWRRLLTFTLRAGQIINPGSYITYSNSPVDTSKETQAKAQAAFDDLLRRLERQRAESEPGSQEESPPRPPEIV